MSDVQTLALKPATQSVPRLEQFARQVGVRLLPWLVPLLLITT